MSGKINLSNSWQDSFNSMNLQENEPITLSPEAVIFKSHHILSLCKILTKFDYLGFL